MARPKNLLQSFEIHLPVSREHHHHEALVRFHHDHFGQFFSWHMEGLGEIRCRKSYLVAQDLVGNLLAIQIVFQSSQDTHDRLLSFGRYTIVWSGWRAELTSAIEPCMGARLINRRGCAGPSCPSGTRTCRPGVRTWQSE